MNLPDNEGAALRWLKGIEKQHGVHPEDGTRSTCTTGDPYVTLMPSEGSPIKTEGHPCDTFPTHEQAWSRWCEALDTYLSDRPGKIHWRTRPNLIPLHEGGDPVEPAFQGYAVYARLFAEEA